ncbi:hypothetical protein AVEN_17297-1 [Araneus ventricosus]|uniref:MADF domain-containing protein n=1 Tax=Araneus ventricosus TaxID=182803 RepID=A0A4Y2PQX3_ARAVE|nr:hypothetical protein AVEN_17297-1 [Araneus ventricosus]
MTLGENDESISIKEIMRRWTNVRDSFAKFCRKESEVKSGVRAAKKKKYVYHNQMRFLRKLYAAENAEGNAVEVAEDDAPRIDTETLITTIYPRTWSQDTETVSDAGGEDNLTSVETASTTSQLSGSIFNKRKQLDESELRNSKVLVVEKFERHLSFFKGIIPSLEEFNEQEVLKFQMGVLQLISNINDQRHRASHAQLPAQFFSFPSQPGPSAYLPSVAASYPSGQPIFPTFWSAVCPKCSSESVSRESSSKPVD